MILDIVHETHYDYGAPLNYALQSLCLTPGDDEHQAVLEWQLQVPGRLYAQRDAYGNHVHTWTLDRPRERGTVRAWGRVDTRDVAWLVDPPGSLSPHYYVRASPLAQPDAALSALGARHLLAGVHTADALALARDVIQRVAYRSGSTDVATGAAQALAQGAGVCQDHAHVYIAACRAHGVAARYVSGYFYAPDAPDLASHAWADVCIDWPERRWLSVDVTHGCVIDERHVRLASGTDYTACPPIRGVRAGGGEERMKVVVSIERAGTTRSTPPPHNP